MEPTTPIPWPLTWYIRQTGDNCWRIVSRENFVYKKDAEEALARLEAIPPER